MMNKPILLVEDNPDDEMLTIRALKKNNILNEVVVARDGVEALDWLFGTGPHADRDLSVMPQLTLLDAEGMRVVALSVEDARNPPVPAQTPGRGAPAPVA